MNNKLITFTKRATLALSLGLAAMTLTTTDLNAQDGGGVFGRGFTPESGGSYQEESLLRERPGAATYYNVTGDGITNNGIGQSEAPLGSGIAILIGAGLGYVALKKKEDGQ